MIYIDNIQFIKQLIGKKVLFKLTDEDDDKGLIGILKCFEDNLIIERYGIKLVVELQDLYGIEEYK